MTDTVERRMTEEISIYYDLHLPAGDGPHPLLIALHGYGGDKKSMMRLARRIEAPGFAIAALQGPHQHLVYPTPEKPQLGFGFGWLSNFKPEESVALHHRAVGRIIDELTANGSVDPARVYLLGFSQSVGVNFRFAFTCPERVRGVIAVCGGIPGDWESEGKYRPGEVDVLYIAAERDEFYTPERIRGYARALDNRARSVELRFFDAGHEVPRDSWPVIRQWLERENAESAEGKTRKSPKKD